MMGLKRALRDFVIPVSAGKPAVEVKRIKRNLRPVDSTISGAIQGSFVQPKSRAQNV
jgi:hypothetical protein